MTVACKDCSRASASQQWGGYSMACTACCARFVFRAWPDKDRMSAAMDTIELRQGRPSRDDIKVVLKGLILAAKQGAQPQVNLL
jgi:hypothetical protein